MVGASVGIHDRQNIATFILIGGTVQNMEMSNNKVYIRHLFYAVKVYFKLAIRVSLYEGRKCMTPKAQQKEQYICSPAPQQHALESNFK